ncbi:MAG: glycosyltransferase [Planctomycetaceae bacterium]|nr:glycosyltransferase [Planctomycetaceae bacterium]
MGGIAIFAGNGAHQAEHGTGLDKLLSKKTVSIIIAARNNAKYLAEALESALSQTVACEVIYSDDCSYDNSLDVASQYKGHGVKVLATPHHKGVCEARNAGADASTGNFITFLDGDDIFPPDFVEKHLEAMKEDTPFSYCSAQAFGDHDTFWGIPDWDDSDIWRNNFVNTSALWNRHAFMASGRWQDNFRTMWDWDLAIRGSRLGKPQRSDAVLNYRQRSDSWSSQTHKKDKNIKLPYFPEIRKLNARVSVGSIFSGRVPDLFKEWMSCLANSVKSIRTKHPIDLTILDNSSDVHIKEMIRKEANRYTLVFGSIQIIPFSHQFVYENEKQRREKVAQFMSHACNRLRSEMRGDIHWVVEDDIIVPVNAGHKLFEVALEGFIPPQAVSGCYRSRHQPSRYVGGWLDDNEAPQELRVLGTAPMSVDFCGTGCLMYWDSRTPRYWGTHFQGTPAHDWEWCHRLKSQNGQILMLPSVQCGHAQNAENLLY